MEARLTYAWAVPVINISHSLAIVIDISWFSFVLTTKHQDDALKKFMNIFFHNFPTLSSTVTPHVILLLVKTAEKYP